MRVLITGGFGFIGGRIARHFQAAGHGVVLGSREAKMPPEWLPDSKVAQIVWSNSDALEQVCSGVNLIVHAAGMNAQDCRADPVAALEVNGVATARLVAAAAKARVNRLLYLSTAHVYASPLAGTFTEAACPNNLDPYASSHLAGENVVLNASQQKDLEGVVLRISNAFGPPAHKEVDCWTLLVNDLCRQAVETGKMTLRSGGGQRRDFVSMTKLCHIADHLATRDIDVSMRNIFNVGAGASRTVIEMAQCIQQRCKVVLGFEPELIRPIPLSDEARVNLVYQSEALEALGVSVKTNDNNEIDDLLAFCSASFKNNNKIL
jgi:UDP-glucose 4-epimerase